MDEAFIQQVMFDSLMITMLTGAPMLLAGMLVGLVISIFQATTSIQEQTLTFVPKMVAIIVSMIAFGPWIMRTLIEYSEHIVELMVYVARP